MGINSKIILFDWIRRSTTGNFFLVSDSGPSILKLDEQSMAIKKIQSLNEAVLNSWFDSKKQYLAINFADKSNRIKIYDLNKVDEGINFKYPKYIIDIIFIGADEDEMGMPTFRTNPYMDQSLMLQKKVSSQTIDIVNLYGDSFLMHINSLIGKLYLYKLGDNPQPIVFNILAESIVNYNVVDNLLILNYIIEKISTVFDVRKDGGSQNFGAPRTIIPEDISNVQIDSILSDKPESDLLGKVDYHEKEQIDTYSNSSDWIINIFYSKENLNLDDNLIMNASKRCLMTIELRLEEALLSSEPPVEIFLFLFRRYKSKELYISHLRELLLSQTKLFNIALIFNKILSNYRIALEEM